MTSKDSITRLVHGIGINDADYSVTKRINGKQVMCPCIFVTHAINNLLNSQPSQRGKYPKGVSLNKSVGKYQAHITKYGKSKCLGLFCDVGEAELAYKKEKRGYISEIAFQQSDYKLAKALILRAQE